MFHKRPGQEPLVEEVTVRQTAQKVSGRRPAQSVRHVLVDDPLERLQTRLRDLVRGLHELYEEQGHLAPIEPGEGYYPLHETLYAPPQGCVVLYDTDRVPPRLMLLTGDALDQSPDRPLETEPLERRRTPQKLREDYQELPDALHETRIKVFVCPLASCHAGSSSGTLDLISSATRVTSLTFCGIKRPEDLHWHETFRPPTRIYPQCHKRRRMTDERMFT